MQVLEHFCDCSVAREFKHFVRYGMCVCVCYMYVSMCYMYVRRVCTYVCTNTLSVYVCVIWVWVNEWVNV